jgi:hypothetical protein
MGKKVIATRREFFYTTGGGLAALTVKALPQKAEGEIFTQIVTLNGNDWLISVDPRNEGRENNWFVAPRADARPTKAPWVMQDIFPGYHGVAWYWREFVAPSNSHAGGHYLLRFEAVDYLADIWLNGKHIGGHEGGETPFAIDATGAIKPNQKNCLAVRVLNPTYEGIDGFALKQTPSGSKQYPVQPNAVYNAGGIVDSVDLVLAPPVRLEDVYVIPDFHTGEVRIQTTVRNASSQPRQILIHLAIAPDNSAATLATTMHKQSVAPGETRLDAILHVKDHRLWELNDPFLYRVGVRVQSLDGHSIDERSVRCGFRDLRFENGYFRFNGRRIFLHGPLYRAHYPIGYTVPPDEDLLRRDVANMKALGYNFCRNAFGGGRARQLDLFDELGILVYQEHYGSWQLEDSPQMKDRFDRSIGEIIRRDRNHPSIAMWGMLNETREGPVFQHAVQSLPMIRALDETRMVVLNSGTYAKAEGGGTISNPGSSEWEDLIRDVHTYPDVPHTAQAIQVLRTGQIDNRYLSPDEAKSNKPLFLSEYGQCAAIDFARTLGHYEQLGKEGADDALYIREQFDRLLVDWKRWRLDECWAQTDDYFVESHRNLAKLRQTGGNAVRANLRLVGHVATNGIADQAYSGRGPADVFRELKPSQADTVRDLTAPLRWCLFAEPLNAYRGSRIRLEAVLSNHDFLKAGSHVARLQVVGPDLKSIMQREVTVQVAEPGMQPESPFSQLVFSEEFNFDLPAGRYRFTAAFEQKGEATGGEAEFYVTEAATMPPVAANLVLWGQAQNEASWLALQRWQVRDFVAQNQTARELILALGAPPSPGGATAFAELARHIGRGSVVVFLDPRIFADGDKLTRWLPLAQKGKLESISQAGGFYRPDAWAKHHPIFDGLSAGGIMDYTFYREIIPVPVFTGLETPEEAVCGEVKCSGGSRTRTYESGLHVAVYRLGHGRFILNNLQIRENLGSVPAAEHLLRNLLNYASRDLEKPVEDLPGDFESQLQALGFA